MKSLVHMHKACVSVCLCILLAFGALEARDRFTSAGIIERELQKEYGTKPLSAYREIPLIELEVPSEQLCLPDTNATVWIGAICFRGNTIVPCEVLERATATFLNQSICMRDIEAICREVQDHYVRCGYVLARAYPPPQRIEDGCLIIEVLEGTLGTITVCDNFHYCDEYILSYFSHLCGLPVNYGNLLRALFLLNENQDLCAKAVFVKGQKCGTTDLVIRVTDERPLHLYTNTNNYGTGPTTQWRTGGRLDYGNLYTMGDTLSVAGVIGFPPKNLRFVDVFYTIPYNRDGGYFSAGYLFTDSRLDDFIDLDLQSDAEVFSLEWDNAVLRKRLVSVDAYVTFEYKQINNYTLGSIYSSDKLRILGAGLDFDVTDRFYGRNVGDITLFAGLPDVLGGSRRVDPRSSREGAGGEFLYLTASVARIQPLPKCCYLTVDLWGQISANLLPVAEQFYIGGYDTVRGYTMAVALGDQGYGLNVELRMPPFYIRDKKIPFIDGRWGEYVQFVAFVDHGAVYVKGHRDRNLQSDASLTGTGLGARFYGPCGMEICCDVGFPLTSQLKTATAIAYFRLVWNPF